MTKAPSPSLPQLRSASDHDQWRVFAVAGLGVFLVVSSLSSLNVALPSLQTDLGASSRELQWVVDAYAVVFGGLLLTGGAIGDRLGRRRTLVIGFGGVSAAGVLGAAATSVGVVITARVLAGVGAALMLPATLSVITEVFRGPAQARAIAMWSGLAGAGGALGPAFGGWLIQWSWWGSVFVVNALLAGLGIVGALWFVPELPLPLRRRLDPIGSFLSVVAVGGVLFAVIEAPGHWRSTEVALGLVCGLGGLVLFLRHEQRIDEPLLPMAVFAPRRVRVGALTLLLSAVGFNGVLFVASLFLQFGWGESPLATGLLILPIGVTEFAVSTRCVTVARWIGTSRTIALGLLSMAVGYAGMAFISTGDRVGFVVAGLVAGVGNGLVIPLSVERVVGGGDGALAGVRAGVNETAIELGASLGVALLGGVQRLVFAHQLPDGVPSDSFGDALLAAADELAVVEAFERSGQAALVSAGVLVLLAIPWVLMQHGSPPEGEEP